MPAGLFIQETLATVFLWTAVDGNRVSPPGAAPADTAKGIWASSDVARGHEDATSKAER